MGTGKGVRWGAWVGVAVVIAAMTVSGCRTQTPRAPAESLPACDRISTWDEGDQKDCQLTSTDHVGLLFQGRTIKKDNGAQRFNRPMEYEVDVHVLSPNGKEQQLITEPADKPCGNGFFLRDLDGDGRDEVLIMTGCGGSGGENLAIWRATQDSTQFVRAGEMFGFLNFWRTQDGFIAQYAHSSAASGEVSLYEFVDNRLIQAAALEVTVASFDDPWTTHPWIVTGNTKCALSREGRSPATLADGDVRLKAHGIDPAAVEQHLCAALGDYYGKK
ncbi:hypothetical protein DE4585_04926 [Mycobacteroides salmoniphilum]|uniref:Uncharacterized protein n=1 Tax=Mycobacteroides salmoniphilum TaxID=404941 RepID=A0A4R8RXL3_9MYCO|nr:hypothetical protein [Mycobacteroides salmoniphilum]TDZ77531.1 hypothetical protein DE4585_04926 [Mycobacteroides salmoniphilum]